MTEEDTWSGWLTCAECSSLGLDKATGNGTFPKTGTCASCGGPWPKRPQDFEPGREDDTIPDLHVDKRDRPCNKG